MSETATTTPTDAGASDESTATDATRSTPTTAAAAKSDLSADERAELTRLRDVHKDEQKHRREATNNHRDAEAYRNLAPALLKALGINDGDAPKDFDAKQAIADLTSKFETAERERVRSEVARTEGVNPRYVVGATEDEMRASATEYKADLEAAVDKRVKGVAPAAAPAGEVTANGKVDAAKQITSRDELKKMTRAEILDAYKDGRLEDQLAGNAT